MPIPQIKNKSQSWRANKKKYYINRSQKNIRPAKKIIRKQERFSFNFNYTDVKRKIILAAIVLFLGGVLFSLTAVAWISRDLPDPGGLLDRQLAQSTIIYDRTGEEVLYEIHGDQKRTLVNLADLPVYIKQATIAIEDKDFYNHGGISLWGIFRGVIWRKIRGLPAHGGSTLTQQFVKNAILTSERSVKRKVKEWILSYRLEQKYSKDEILQMYFNEIPYGSTAYGVEAASERYFGKNAKDISLAEAAILAALPQAPSKYSPYGPNQELLLGRQKYILDLMAEQGYITDDEAEAAKAEEFEFKGPATNIKAPHFVMYVKEMLSEKYGEKTVEQGGLKIYTTLDLYKQNIAEEVINEIAPKNAEKWNASNAALVSLDPKTGQILAMVGSRDYFNDEIDGQVNICTSNRQPGSSLKPLVYATAFIKGYTPNTILYDVVTNFTPEGVKQSPYEPHNYDLNEHGPITMRRALAGSLNIPAVKTLYLAGVDKVIDIAQELGYSTLNDPDRYGLSLVLGGGEVKLLEHANAYSAFAREGIIHPTVSILKVEDKNGNVLEEYKETPEKKVLDPKISRMINDVLSDNSARAYVFGESNWLTLGSRPVAAKTGTTNDYHDAWTMGYTPSLVTGVWVGNNDNSEMKRGADGSVVAAPIWHDYMKRVLGDTPIEEFRKPEIPKTGKPILDGEAGAATTVKIDKFTGLLATEFTPPDSIEEKTFFEPHSILYFIDKDNPLSEPPQNPGKDPQFNLWEGRVLAWAEKQAASGTESGLIISSSTPPKEYDNLHTAENQPEIEILAPENNQVITNPLLIGRVRATAPRGVSRVEYYINGNLFFTNDSYPYNLQKSIDFLNNGFHNLKIRVCDDVNNCTAKEVEFNLVLENNNNNNQQTELLIISPQSGLALSNIDFPLTVKLEIKNSSRVSKVNIYSIKESGEPQLISVLNPAGENIAAGLWEDAPASGTYKIYGEALTWDNKIIKTEDVVVIVNNIASQ
ncbi:MAG: penicillin-binding protein [Candidatus Falkowbacteria bacterium]